MYSYFVDLPDEDKKAVLSGWLSFVLNEIEAGSLKIALRGAMFGNEVLIINIDEAVKCSPPDMLMNAKSEYITSLLWKYDLLLESSVSIRRKVGVWRHGTVFSMPKLVEFLAQYGSDA